MAQNYVLVARKNPNKPMLAPKFYAQARSNKKVSVKDICTRVSERSSFSTGELEGAISEFLIELRHVLEEGNIAQLGDLGNFRLTLKTGTPTETAKEFNAARIKACRVRFHAGADLQKLCKGMKYALYKSEEVKAETPAPAPPNTPQE